MSSLFARLAPIGFLAAVLCAPCLAQTTDPSATLTGDWGGERSTLIGHGIDLGGSYGSEVANNLAGGKEELTRYTDQWVLFSNFDLQKLIGLDGASFKILVTDRNGRDLGADADLHNLELVQEVWGRGQTWRLTQLEYRQKWFDDGVDLKLGRMTVGEDFASFNCEFQNLTFCGSMPGNVRGDLWFNWPVSQWAARIRLAPSPQWYFQIGVYQVNPTYIDDSWARHDGLFPYSPGGTTGALLPVELTWLPQSALPGSYRIGFWYSTSDYNQVGNSYYPAIPGVEPTHHPYGAYLNLQQRIFGTPTGRGGDLFLNITQSDRETSQTVDRQITMGIQIKGPFDGRPRDSIGFAIGTSHVNSLVAQYDYLIAPLFATNLPVPGSEYASELYYGYSPARWIVLRPNLQYIVHPGGVSSYPNIVVVGLKTSIDF
jgi:porin